MPRKALQTLSLKDLICIGDDEFREIFKGSPIKRSKRRGLLRNAAVVLGNQRDVGLVDLLAQRLLCEPEELVRGHLAWALGRIGGADAAEALKTASERETEVYVQDEIQYALEMM
jgi:epoxyqueuosine reductase